MENNEIKSLKNQAIFIIAASAIVAAVFGSFFGFLTGSLGKDILSNFSGKINTATKKSPEVSRQTVIEEESAVTDTVEKATPSVVSIVISQNVPIFRNSDPFGFFSDPFGDNGSLGTEKQKVGGGTGFFVSADGMIVTNKHVASSQDAEYTVLTSDGKEYPAKVIAVHPTTDLAVIKIEGKDFPVLDLGDSDNLKRGQTAIAIGYSLGEFSNTVSKGIISGLSRDITAGSGLGGSERLTGIIQTDAAINPGNSGGPLLDINGKAIGVNVAMAQGAENIGFAIPVNQVKRTIDQIKDKGKISIPFLGVRYILNSKEIQEKNNLPFDYGVIIRTDSASEFAVIPGSPADIAGIAENDIILEINGKKITADYQLADAISQYNPGDEIAIKIWHKGETKEMKVKLGEKK